MTESILEKKHRILGNAPEGSPAILQAVRAGLWTPQDALELQRHLGSDAMTKKTGSSHAERVAATMRK